MTEPKSLAEIDLAVARKEGFIATIWKDECWLSPLESLRKGHEGMAKYQPTTDWSIGGPLIEKYSIEIRKNMAIGVNAKPWFACALVDGFYDGKIQGNGETPLIAAMKALVNSKEGEG